MVYIMISCTMNVDVEGGVINCEIIVGDLLFNPFPRASSTLITAPSLSGKSLFLKRIIERQDLYFSDNIERVIILNCNPRVSFYTLEQQTACHRPLPVVEEYLVSEFDFDTLQDTDVCIVEDLQSVTDDIRLLLTALCHHANLIHVFLIAHGVLGQKNFELLSLVHRVLLFLQSTAVGRLANYIIQHFFIDPDVKDLLKRVLVVCSKNNNLLLLEINNLPANIQPFHLAISNLLQLQQRECPFAIVYPYPSKANMYANLSANTRINTLTPETVVESLPNEEELIDGGFVILSRANVASFKNNTTDEVTHADDKCLAKDQWNAIVIDLESQIEDFIVHRNWSGAKCLLKEILRNDNICILQDARQIQIKNKPHAIVGIMDFIMVAIRKDGPSEVIKSDTNEYRMYRMFVHALLDKHCPKSIFKNKLLMQNTNSVSVNTGVNTYKRKRRFQM